MKRNGFTMLEFLIALAIFSIGLLSIAAMQTNGVKNISYSDTMNQAIALGKSKLEYVRNLPYDSPDLSTGQHSSTIAGTAFSIDYSVSEDNALLTKTISLTVKWTDKITHTMSLEALRSKS